MKTSIISIFLMSLFLCKSNAQKPNFAIHIYNPLAMFQKAGVKLEYRNKKMGFLITGIQYYGSLPKYPGTQLGIETRYYSNLLNKNEKFIYGKVYGGYQQQVNASGSGFFNQSEVSAGNYYGVGGGIGKHFNFKYFFIDINIGLKISFSDVKQKDAFFITGPASYLDLHFNLGFQF